MATQSGPSWWVGLTREQLQAQAQQRADAMSAAKEAEAIDGLRGLIELRKRGRPKKVAANQ